MTKKIDITPDWTYEEVISKQLLMCSCVGALEGPTGHGFVLV